MKKNTALSIILLAWIALVMGGCAAMQKPPQEKYRGKENAPFMNVTPLEVNWNLAMTMSKPDFEEYKRRVNLYNDYVRNIANANAETAYSDKQWVNDPNSGPAAVPYTMTKGGVGVYDPAAQTNAMREEAKRLREYAQEILKKPE